MGNRYARTQPRDGGEGGAQFGHRTALPVMGENAQGAGKVWLTHPVSVSDGAMRMFRFAPRFAIWAERGGGRRASEPALSTTSMRRV